MLSCRDAETLATLVSPSPSRQPCICEIH